MDGTAIRLHQFAILLVKIVWWQGASNVMTETLLIMMDAIMDVELSMVINALIVLLIVTQHVEIANKLITRTAMTAQTME